MKKVNSDSLSMRFLESYIALKRKKRKEAKLQDANLFYVRKNNSFETDGAEMIKKFKIFAMLIMCLITVNLVFLNNNSYAASGDTLTVELKTGADDYTEEWTNKNVQVLVTLPEVDGLTSVYYKKTGDASYSAHENTTYSENMILIEFDEAINDSVTFVGVDVTGNVLTDESSSYSIKIDKTNPEITSVSKSAINEKINLTVLGKDAESGIKYYSVSDNEDITDWLEYSEIVTNGEMLIETTGVGTKYLRVKDLAGNESKLYELVIYRDIIAPIGTVKFKNANIIDGVSYINNANVTLQLTAVDDVTETSNIKMKIFNRDDYLALKSLNDIDWVDFSGEYSWKLPEGDGSKTVYLVLKDMEGNISLTIVGAADSNKAKYFVHHYLENAEDENYTEYVVTEGRGVIGASVDVENLQRTIAGATFEKGTSIAGGSPETTVIIKSGDSTNIYMYYSRNEYSLLLDKDGNVDTVTGAGTYKHGADVSVSAILNQEVGYTYSFKYWLSSDTTLVLNQSNQNATFKMPIGSVKLTATAERTPNEYTVTLNANGGSVSPELVTVKYREAYGTLPTPTRSGYLFEGWYTTTGTDGVEISDTSIVNVVGNQELYAKWSQINVSAPTVNAYYVETGAGYTGDDWTNKEVETIITVQDTTTTGIAEIQYSSDKSSWQTLEFEASSGLQQSGTTYTGTEVWDLVDTDTTYYIRAVDTLGNASTSYAEFKLKYDITPPTIPTYVATYIDDGTIYTSGTPTTKKVQTTISASDTASGLGGIQYSYDKQSWVTFDFDISNGLHLESDGITYTGTEPWDFRDRDQTAYFRSFDNVGNATTEYVEFNIIYDIDYSVTYNANNGNITGSTLTQTTKTVTYGQTYGGTDGTNMPTAERESYEFLGWFTAETGGTQVTADTVVTEGAKNQVLYAQWESTIVEYKVQHWQQTVTGGDEQNSTNYALVSADTQTLTGTVGTSITPAVNSYTGFTAPSTQTVTIASDGSTVVNYYYTRNSYTVTFDANSGTVSPTSTTVKYGGTYGTLPTPTCGSHTFEGWYLEETWENAVTSSTTVQTSADHEIHAKWTNTAPRLEKKEMSVMGSYYIWYYVVDDDGDDLYYKYIDSDGIVPDTWTAAGGSKIEIDTEQGSLTYWPSEDSKYYIFTDGIDTVYINT